MKYGTWIACAVALAATGCFGPADFGSSSAGLDGDCDRLASACENRLLGCDVYDEHCRGMLTDEECQDQHVLCDKACGDDDLCDGRCRIEEQVCENDLDEREAEVERVLREIDDADPQNPNQDGQDPPDQDGSDQDPTDQDGPGDQDPEIDDSDGGDADSDPTDDVPSDPSPRQGPDRPRSK